MPEEQSISLHEDGSVAIVPQKAEKKGGRRIGYYYIILKSLKESRKNDVVKCLYIKGLTNFGYCVIKEGSQGDTKDKNGRDIQDRLKWQRILHERLAGKVRLPKYLGSFEENGNYYLVMEYIKGKPLHNLVKKDYNLRQHLLAGAPSGFKVLGYIGQVIDILDTLHQHSVVHRDVTLNNFMVMPNGNVAVIDMELSYSLDDQFPSPPFALGTFGYMSPEQEAIALPTVKEDVFSVGAIILHAWSGISPFKFARMPEEQLKNTIGYFVEDEIITGLICQCMNADAQLRPELSALQQGLRQYEQDKQQKISRPVFRSNPFSFSDIEDTFRKGLQGLGDPLLMDADKGWFTAHQSEKPENTHGIRKAWYASFNLGSAGVLYFLGRAYAAGHDITSLSIPVQKGLDLIRIKYLEKKDRSKPGLHFGSDGIAMALAESVMNDWLDPGTAMKSEWPFLLSADAEGLDLFEGLAGQGIAHLHCSALLDGTREQYFAEELMNRQLADGSWDLRKKRKVNYLGAGQAGIIMFLLKYGASKGLAAPLEQAIKGIDHLMKSARKKGDLVTWKKGDDHLSEHWWCEGNPGMALMFLRAYEITEDPLYRQWVDMTLEGHEESRLWGALSLCHGLSGLGETYLEAAHVLQDEKWRDKAKRCVQTVMHLQRTTKNGGAFWYVDRERHPVASFMIGNTGVMHLLLRYLNPGKFGFPGLG